MWYLGKAFGKTIFVTLWKTDHVLTEPIALGEVVGKIRNTSVHWLFFVSFSKLLQERQERWRGRGEKHPFVTHTEEQRLWLRAFLEGQPGSPAQDPALGQGWVKGLVFPLKLTVLAAPRQPELKQEGWARAGIKITKQASELCEKTTLGTVIGTWNFLEAPRPETF